MNPQENLPCSSNELASKHSEEIIEIMKSIHTTLIHKLEKSAKQYGFTAPQIEVIFRLYKTPSITLNELSNYMRLTKSTVSGIVDRLTKQGIVIREIPKNNRRIVRLSLSEEFKKNNDIGNMKKCFISQLVFSSINTMEPEEIEKILYGLRQFNSLLNSSD